MPFTRPALTVGPGARAAPDARRWVRDALREIAREDLVESAELAISEVVGNAFLHGSEPITIRLRGSEGRPRIEVHDASPTAPPTRQAPMPDPFAAGGRGLSLVARSSLAWGITLDDDGKVVWFDPDGDLSEEGVEAELADRRTTVR